MNYERALGGQVLPLTQILRKIPVPQKAVVAEINAVHRDNELIIFVPKGDKRQKLDQSRDIQIQ